MKGKLKCLSLSVIFTGVFIICLCFPCFAEKYSEQYPDYLNPSGGCFIDCQTNLGRGTIIVPVNYCKDTFGFDGRTGYNVMNLTSSTVSGIFVSDNGRTSYNVRASGFSTFQYRTIDQWNQYEDLTVSRIYNTNCYFIDAAGERQNDKYYLNISDMVSVMSLAVMIIILFLGISQTRKRGY